MFTLLNDFYLLLYRIYLTYRLYFTSIIVYCCHVKITDKCVTFVLILPREI